jgi:uncharacterized protein
MAHSPFVVHAGDLLRDRSDARDVTVQVPVDWHVELSRVVPEPPLVAELTLAHLSGGVLVRGTVVLTAHHTCHRCLEEWEEVVEVDVAQPFLTPDTAGEDDYEVDGDQIDLEQMLRDEVLLAMPLVPTCGPHCPGVVVLSETGLNDGSPDDAGQSHSPFAVLEDWLGPEQGSDPGR